MLTLVLRALVPAGFMPTFSAAGGLQLVICSASGSQRIIIGEDGKARPAGHKSQADQPCAYAGATNLALAPSEAVVAFRPIDVTPVSMSLSQPGLSPVLAGPTLGSRAPPLAS